MKKQKRILKKALSLLLVLAIGISTISVAFAAEAAQANDPSYMPLRFISEGVGANVSWDSSKITVQHNGNEFIFAAGSTAAYENGNAFELNFPIAIVEDRAMIAAMDTVFLFGDVGALPQTIITAVATALQHMDTFNIPGLTMAIVDSNTGFTWTQGLGFANTAAHTPMNENTVVGIGSIGKLFTAIAVMQLVEEGILDLDTPIVEYLPNFSVLPALNSAVNADYRNITTRMLMTHTSGIPENFWGYASVTTNGHSPQQMNDFLEIMATYHMITEEGTTFSYNNNGTILLGVLVAHLTGNDNYFNDFVAYTNQNIFEPMGMSRTSFVTTDYLYRNAMRRYGMDGLPAEYLFLNVLPAGSTVTTAADMSRFMHLLLNNGTSDGETIISQNSLTQMLTPYGNNHGLIFVVHDAFGFRTIGHNGGVPDFSNADMVMSMEHGLGVFVGSNSAMHMLPILQFAFAATILQTAVVEKGGTVNIPPAAAVLADPSATPIARDAAELAAFEGVYMQGSAYFVIELIDGVLHLIVPQLGDDIIFPMTPLSDGSFDTVQGRMWFDVMEDTVVLSAGDAPTPFAFRVNDTSIFEVHYDFENWIGTFAPVFPANETSMAVSVIIHGIDSRGIPYEFVAAMGAFLPVLIDEWYFSQARNIERDEDGKVMSFEYFGMRFERQ